jgi:hypothetical protein
MLTTPGRIWQEGEKIGCQPFSPDDIIKHPLYQSTKVGIGIKLEFFNHQVKNPMPGSKSPTLLTSL